MCVKYFIFHGWQRLTRIESQIKRSVTDVQRQFGDIVTFQVCCFFFLNKPCALV